MDFKQFREVFNENMKEVLSGVVYEVAIDKDEIVDIYLDSFPIGTNKLFRERREYDCSCCKNFIKQIGGLVSINDDGSMRSIWDFETGDTKFQTVVNALRDYVYSKNIDNVFATSENKYGVKTNFEYLEDGRILTYDHFYLDTPLHLKLNKIKYQSVGSYKGEIKTLRDVFKRSLEEITIDSVLTVLELISQNSLYRGQEWESSLKTLLEYMKEYRNVENKDTYLWKNVIKVGNIVGKIKNHSMGVLLMEISEGTDLDIAVRKYESIVAPENYKRPKPIFTKRMLEDAQNKITDMGYLESLGRRYANLNDIKINNILFCNRDVNKVKGNVFAEMLSDVTYSNKNFSKVSEMKIDDFIKNILPSATSIELFLESKHRNNLVSLIAPENINSKTMFKWNNNFSWAYSGNIADSSMRERVKSAGGKIDGVLRFSIQWNDIDSDNNDLDAHCIEPDGNEIYFADKGSSSGGRLDVDIIEPRHNQVAVENITWPNTKNMKKGTYKFFVKNYNYRGGKTGFRAEIEFNGKIYSFEYNKPLRDYEDVHVAVVDFDGKNFTIKELIPSTLGSVNLWGLNTNSFVPVNVMMLSPNYWDEQKGIGNKHYFFMLDGCISDETPNGFYNEFLNPTLTPHRKVLEALGSKMSVEHTSQQLSGLGFSNTKPNNITVKVTTPTLTRILTLTI